MVKLSREEVRMDRISSLSLLVDSSELAHKNGSISTSNGPYKQAIKHMAPLFLLSFIARKRENRAFNSSFALPPSRRNARIFKSASVILSSTVDKANLRPFKLNGPDED